MNRLLNENELARYREWAREAPGAGTGSIPTDLGLLLGHVEAQAAELRRLRTRETALADAIDELLDYVDHGGAPERRAEIRERARAARQT